MKVNNNFASHTPYPSYQNQSNPYPQHKWNSRGSKSVVWRCITRMDSPSKCQARTVKEDLLHEVIVEVINSLIDDSDYLETLEENIREVLNHQYDENVEDVDDRLHELLSLIHI